MAGRPPHRWTKQAEVVADYIYDKSDEYARVLMDPATNPAFGVKLTKQEQADRFLRLRPEDWDNILQERGPLNAINYWLHMTKICNELDIDVPPPVPEEWREPVAPPEPQMPDPMGQGNVPMEGPSPDGALPAPSAPPGTGGMMAQAPPPQGMM